jgi:hypothetical protein
LLHVNEEPYLNPLGIFWYENGLFGSCRGATTLKPKYPKNGDSRSLLCLII